MKRTCETCKHSKPDISNVWRDKPSNKLFCEDLQTMVSPNGVCSGYLEPVEAESEGER